MNESAGMKHPSWYLALLSLDKFLPDFMYFSESSLESVEEQDPPEAGQAITVWSVKFNTSINYYGVYDLYFYIFSSCSTSKMPSMLKLQVLSLNSTAINYCFSTEFLLYLADDGWLMSSTFSKIFNGF